MSARRHRPAVTAADPNRVGATLDQGSQMDMQQLLAAAQQMQQQLVSAQQELADAEVEGTAGGGMVTATVNGQGELVDLAISAAAIDVPGKTDTTFFEVGGMVVRYPDMTRMLHRDGFELGDHTPHPRRRFRSCPAGRRKASDLAHRKRHQRRHGESGHGSCARLYASTTEAVTPGPEARMGSIGGVEPCPSPRQLQPPRLGTPGRVDDRFKRPLRTGDPARNRRGSC